MYLDPGAWSIVAQVIIGVLVAIPVLVGIYWKRVVLLFKRGKKSEGK